jgi:hypothetical protein
MEVDSSLISEWEALKALEETPGGRRSQRLGRMGGFRSLRKVA